VIDDIVMGFEDSVGERFCHRFHPFWTIIIYFRWHYVHLRSGRESHVHVYVRISVLVGLLSLNLHNIT
jgi:hypothetical protein